DMCSSDLSMMPNAQVVIALPLPCGHWHHPPPSRVENAVRQRSEAHAEASHIHPGINLYINGRGTCTVHVHPCCGIDIDIPHRQIEHQVILQRHVHTKLQRQPLGVTQ